MSSARSPCFPFIKMDTHNHTWELPVQHTAWLFSSLLKCFEKKSSSTHWGWVGNFPWASQLIQSIQSVPKDTLQPQVLHSYYSNAKVLQQKLHMSAWINAGCLSAHELLTLWDSTVRPCLMMSVHPLHLSIKSGISNHVHYSGHKEAEFSAAQRPKAFHPSHVMVVTWSTSQLAKLCRCILSSETSFSGQVWVWCTTEAEEKTLLIQHNRKRGKQDERA